ncbi:hypothetical protein JVU11DRAFT_12768 [Chiua virens]|nr:hypothetical protein JVU11DRAFT_12768 [Chiua virens]
MPSSTRPATPVPSSIPQGTKRAMSDAESVQQESKKARRNSSTEPSTRRDSSNRDNKRRRKRKKKVPIVNSGTAKNEPTQSRLDERSRAPLSPRNEIIRFTSVALDTGLSSSNMVPATNIPSQASSSNHLSKARGGPSHTVDNTTRRQSEAMPSTSKNNNNDTVPHERPVPEPSSSSLEDKVVQLEAELKSKNDLITSHHALLNQVQQSITCQVCLDLMYKPYALAPCGHLACHSCLVNWFTAPPPDNRPLPPPIMRKKTCPHCRAIVRERPVEVWSVKSIAQVVGKSGLLQNLSPLPEDTSEVSNSNVDPWKDIFPKLGAASHRFPWYVPGADIDITDVAPRGEDVGMLDMEDGGIYRCLDCMHEIWDGVCTSCGRVYPGHRPEGEDEDDVGDPARWFDDHMGAEEVDVADDPGWMGLEDGEADDGGDFDDWRPFDPWHYAYRGFIGTIHVDGEDEEDEDDEFSGVAELGLLGQDEEDEESGDDGYESSFIDDEAEEGGIAELMEAHRFCEEEVVVDYLPNGHPRIVELGSDEDEDEDEAYDTREHAPGRRGSVVHSPPDEEDDESEDDAAPPPRCSHRRGRAIESEGSDADS